MGHLQEEIFELRNGHSTRRRRCGFFGSLRHAIPRCARAEHFGRGIARGLFILAVDLLAERGEGFGTHFPEVLGLGFLQCGFPILAGLANSTAERTRVAFQFLGDAFPVQPLGTPLGGDFELFRRGGSAFWHGLLQGLK